jgi:uncharacterized protein YndB with AHSA1/START domain
VAVEQPEVAAVVEREIRIAARPETVFDFFVDPEKMVRWKGRRAELDPRPGGVYRVDINDQAIARGEYVEIDAPNRVVFTWGWEGNGIPVPPGSSGGSTRSSGWRRGPRRGPSSSWRDRGPGRRGR